MPGSLDQLDDFASRLDPREKLLCHVAMLKVYMVLDTLHCLEQAFTPEPAERMERTLDAFTRHCTGIAQVQAQMKRVLAEFRKRGLPVDRWFLIPNPMGRDGSGPRYEIAWPIE